MKLTIFGTSSIFRSTRYSPKETPKASLTCRGKTQQFFSTGNLEKALAAGYTVLVVSTRSRLGTHDQWWVDLVGRENVYLSDDYGQNERIRTAALNKPWREICGKYGIEDKFDWTEFWTVLRPAIMTLLGAKNGYDF